MSYIRKYTRRNKNGDVKTYYAEVESVRIDGKVVQRYIRPLGTDPSFPNNFTINNEQFSFLATQLAEKELTPNEVLDMLEKMGHPVSRESLKSVGITYDFGKKTYSICLSYQKNSKKSIKNAQSVKKDFLSKKQLDE